MILCMCVYRSKKDTNLYILHFQPHTHWWIRILFMSMDDIIQGGGGERGVCRSKKDIQICIYFTHKVDIHICGLWYYSCLGMILVGVRWGRGVCRFVLLKRHTNGDNIHMYDRYYERWSGGGVFTVLKKTQISVYTSPSTPYTLLD